METTGSLSPGESRPLSTTKRTRRSTPRSRRGCAKCKTRRIKCDENWPACQNCLEAGFRCPGFQQPLRWSNKHERFQATPKPFTETCPDESDEDEPCRPGDETAHSSATDPSTDLPRIQNSSSHDRLDPVTVDADLSWLDALSPTPQVIAPCADAQLSDSARLESVKTPGAFDPSASQYDLAGTSLGSLKAPVHLPTALIEYWFRHICPMRSTFDSDINYNRQLASRVWTTSQAVFYAMQAMSAACLMDTLPQLSASLSSLRAQATAAIEEGISRVRTSQLHGVAADLVFAVFALGTSLHWTASTPPEHPFLESARELLVTWRGQLSPADAPLHAYFSQALTYWEMLLAVIGRGSVPAIVDGKRRQYQSKLRQAIHLIGDDCDADVFGPQPRDLGQHVPGTRPNSWCGVSSEVIDAFGQVLALCRSAYHRDSESTLTVAATSNALCDIMVAHDLQKELLAMDFSALLLIQEVEGFPVHTLDGNTPISHLLQTAEAYRHAALLQLHLTFSDLDMTMPRKCHSPIFADTPPDDAVDNAIESDHSRAEFLLTLTLQLVSILEQIPTDSGSRSIHPMLYLSAAAGLRFDTCESSQDAFGMAGGHQSIGGLSNPSTLEPPVQTNQLLRDTLQPALTLTGNPCEHTSHPAHLLGTFIRQSTLEVARARRVVWTRLSNLQQTLPHRASNSMPQLVKAIWREYDSLQPDLQSVHWLQALGEGGLEILCF